MSSATTHYGFTKPAVNDPADEDLWGTEENANWDLLDTTLNTLAGLIAGAMAKRAEAEKAAIEDAFPMTGPMGVIASDQ